jgi:uncharacterized membrane protein YczE
MTGPDAAGRDAVGRGAVGRDAVGRGAAGPESLGPTAAAGARLRPLAATALLAAVCVAWAAVPAGGARAGFRVVLVAAVACGVASLGRLAVGDAQIGGDAFDSLPVRAAAQVAYGLRAVPWSEGLILAILGLEALHRARPWHTAVLGVALLAYLFATHLAEAGERAGTLAAQLPVLAAGLGLLVLAVGAAALPALAAGPGADLLRVLAAAAAVVAAALALPAPRRRP